jgi:methionyl aminopeptidase
MINNVTIHKPEDFAGMHKAGALSAAILDELYDIIEVGMTTEAINRYCHKRIVEAGAIPAPLGYRGFPKSVCTSVNHVVCHGIPSADKVLQDGDIINVDVTSIVDGWYGDTSRMYYVGTPSIKAKNLVEVTYDCMMRGIEQVRPGATTGDIGAAIQEHAESKGYSVVRDYCGHGLGRVFHALPNILHYGTKGQGTKIVEGMFFTVEPMINIGKAATRLNQTDGWTVTTKDRSLSAQFEHSIGVTATGYEIFTQSSKGLHLPK